MVVAGRSYGSPVMTVNRGPQLVQEMKGCRYLRFPGSASSRRQSAQVATSGEAKVRTTGALDGPPASAAAGRDGSMLKPVPPRTATVRERTELSTASGGASRRSRSANESSAAGSPSTSISTPSAVLATDPASASDDAVT
jgi:hypothetical protein